MIPPARSVSESALISTESVNEAVYHALQLFIGRGRRFSAEDLAMALTVAGHPVSRRTVASWIAGDPVDRRTPPPDVLLKLCQLIGPVLTSKVLSRIGQGAYALSPTSMLPAEVVAVLSEGISEFAIRAVDGVFCNADEAALERFADRMIEVLTPFSSKREP